MIQPPQKLDLKSNNLEVTSLRSVRFLSIKKSFSVFKHLDRGYLAKLSYKN